MLSSIGRSAVRRVVARRPQSTNKSLQSIWHFQRVDTHSSSAHSRRSVSAQRSYATATKVATKPKAKKTTAAKPKTKKTTKTTPATAVKKPITKKKVVAKKPKPKAKKPVKKVLTEEQKSRADLKALKEAALSPPTKKPDTVWQAVLTETTRADGTGGDVALKSKSAAARYKSLSPAEIESYNHAVNQNKAENEAALKSWVESHTPDQIRIANNARRSLLRAGNKGGHTQIPDSRIPKGRATAMALWMGERHASGDLKGLGAVERVRLLAKEWKDVPASVRQDFEARSKADGERYVKEYQAAFGRQPGDRSPR